MFKIELENRDFRKSLYFYIVDAGKKKKKKKKNELRLGAGIILNQELTYSRHWGKWAAGACQRPDTSFLVMQVGGWSSSKPLVSGQEFQFVIYIYI